MNVELSKTAPRAIQIEWCQADGETPLNCTGLTLAVASTTLPYTPTITPVDLAAGKFDIQPPNNAQADLLRLGTVEGVHLVLSNGTNVPVDDARFSVLIV